VSMLSLTMGVLRTICSSVTTQYTALIRKVNKSFTRRRPVSNRRDLHRGDVHKKDLYYYARPTSTKEFFNLSSFASADIYDDL
jgi:hypothetical protein